MQKKIVTQKKWQLCVCFAFSIALIACTDNQLERVNETDNEKSPPSSPSTSGTYSGDVVIDLTTEPEINIDPALSATEIILQFIPRNKAGFPLAPNQVNVTLLINDEKVDGESLVSISSKQLAFNVNFGLVLDASYSMMISHGDEEAFTPMLLSAKNSIQTGLDIWSEQEGKFSFSTTWFNNSIFSSINTINRQWVADDIADIPLPREGDFTRLFAATDYTIKKMATETAEAGLGPRDQNIILVFSDGQDNLSNVLDNSDSPDAPFTTNNGAEYIEVGKGLTTLDTLIETINSQDNMSVHVIGMGSALKASAVDDLKAIATAGNGLYLQNPDASDIEKPFQRVIQEFTTLQTRGIKTPLQASEYKFTLRLENASGGSATECSFQFRVGDGFAEIIREDGADICEI